LGVRGPKSKIEEQQFVEGVMELDSIEKQKRRNNLNFVTDKQTESIVDNNKLLG